MLEPKNKKAQNPDSATEENTGPEDTTKPKKPATKEPELTWWQKLWRPLSEMSWKDRLLLLLLFGGISSFAIYMAGMGVGFIILGFFGGILAPILLIGLIYGMIKVLTAIYEALVKIYETIKNNPVISFTLFGIVAFLLLAFLLPFAAIAAPLAFAIGAISLITSIAVGLFIKAKNGNKAKNKDEELTTREIVLLCVAVGLMMGVGASLMVAAFPLIAAFTALIFPGVLGVAIFAAAIGFLPLFLYGLKKFIDAIRDGFKNNTIVVLTGFGILGLVGIMLASIALPAAFTLPFALPFIGLSLGLALPVLPFLFAAGALALLLFSLIGLFLKRGEERTPGERFILLLAWGVVLGIGLALAAPLFALALPGIGAAVIFGVVGGLAPFILYGIWKAGTAIIAGIRKLYDLWKNGTFFANLAKRISKFFTAIINGIRNAWRSFVKSITDRVTAFFKRIYDALEAFVKRVERALKTLQDYAVIIAAVLGAIAFVLLLMLLPIIGIAAPFAFIIGAVAFAVFTMLGTLIKYGTLNVKLTPAEKVALALGAGVLLAVLMALFIAPLLLVFLPGLAGLAGVAILSIAAGFLPLVAIAIYEIYTGIPTLLAWLKSNATVICSVIGVILLIGAALFLPVAIAAVPLLAFALPFAIPIALAVGIALLVLFFAIGQIFKRRSGEPYSNPEKAALLVCLAVLGGAIAFLAGGLFIGFMVGAGILLGIPVVVGIVYGIYKAAVYIRNLIMNNPKRTSGFIGGVVACLIIGLAGLTFPISLIVGAIVGIIAYAVNLTILNVFKSIGEYFSSKPQPEPAKSESKADSELKKALTAVQGLGPTQQTQASPSPTTHPSSQSEEEKRAAEEKAQARKEAAEIVEQTFRGHLPDQMVKNLSEAVTSNPSEDKSKQPGPQSGVKAQSGLTAPITPTQLQPITPTVAESTQPAPKSTTSVVPTPPQINNAEEALAYEAMQQMPNAKEAHAKRIDMGDYLKNEGIDSSNTVSFTNEPSGQQTNFTTCTKVEMRDSSDKPFTFYALQDEKGAERLVAKKDQEGSLTEAFSKYAEQRSGKASTTTTAPTTTKPASTAPTQPQPITPTVAESKQPAPKSTTTTTVAPTPSSQQNKNEQAFGQIKDDVKQISTVNNANVETVTVTPVDSQTFWKERNSANEHIVSNGPFTTGKDTTYTKIEATDNTGKKSTAHLLQNPDGSEQLITQKGQTGVFSEKSVEIYENERRKDSNRAIIEPTVEKPAQTTTTTPTVTTNKAPTTTPAPTATTTKASTTTTAPTTTKPASTAPSPSPTNSSGPFAFCAWVIEGFQRVVSRKKQEEEAANAQKSGSSSPSPTMARTSI